MRLRVRFHRFVERFEYKRIVIMVTYYKGDNPPVIEVQNSTKVELMDGWAVLPFELRHISKPLFVWPVRIELAVQDVFSDILRIFRSPRTAVVVVLNGGFDTFGAADTENAFIVHMNVLVVLKIVVNAAVALVRTGHMDLLDLLRKTLVFHCAGTLFPGGPAVVCRS